MNYYIYYQTLFFLRVFIVVHCSREVCQLFIDKLTYDNCFNLMFYSYYLQVYASMALYDRPTFV